MFLHLGRNGAELGENRNFSENGVFHGIMRNLVILRVSRRPFRPRCARGTWCNGKASILEVKKRENGKTYFRGNLFSDIFLKKLFHGISWNFPEFSRKIMKSPDAEFAVF